MIAVMLLKLMTSSACLTDAVVTLDGGAAVASKLAQAADDCALGETACHCNCVHSTALPAFVPVLALAARDAPPTRHRTSVFVPLPPTSLLRPPIA